MEKSDFQSKYDRESLLGVRDEYDSMKSLIGQLSSKLTSVSSHIEKEFLSAYRVHMLSVQEELRSLKNQVVDAEVALNDDEEVSKLEHEVTWFSDEATRLRNQSNSMKKDMQHVVGRIEALREQRQYLDEQLKTTMKRSKILEAEMVRACVSASASVSARVSVSLPTPTSTLTPPLSLYAGSAEPEPGSIAAAAGRE